MAKDANSFEQSKKPNNERYYKNNKKRMVIVLVLILSAIVLSIVLGVVLSKKRKTPELKASQKQDTPDIVDKPVEEQIDATIVTQIEAEEVESEKPITKTVDKVKVIDKDILAKGVSKVTVITTGQPERASQITEQLKKPSLPTEQPKKPTSIVEKPKKPSSTIERPEKDLKGKLPVKDTKTVPPTKKEDKTSPQAIKDEDIKDKTLSPKDDKNLPPKSGEDAKEPTKKDTTVKPPVAVKKDEDLVLRTHKDNKDIDKDLLLGLLDPVYKCDIPPCITFPNGLKAPIITPFNVKYPKYKWEVLDLFSLFKKSEEFAKFKKSKKVDKLLKTQEWKDLIKQYFTVLYCDPENIMDKVFVKSKNAIKSDKLDQGIENICDALKIPRNFFNTSYDFLIQLQWFGEDCLKKTKVDHSICKALEQILTYDYAKTPLNELQDIYKKSSIKIEDGCDLKSMSNDEKNSWFKAYITYRLINIKSLYNDIKESLYQSTIIDDGERLKKVIDYSFEFTDKLIGELILDGLYFARLCNEHSVKAKSDILIDVKEVLKSRIKPLVPTKTDPFALGIVDFSYDAFLGKEAKELSDFKGKSKHSKDEILKTAEIIGKIASSIEGITKDMTTNELDTVNFISRTNTFKTSAEELMKQTDVAVKAYKDNNKGEDSKGGQYLKEIEFLNAETAQLVAKNSEIFAAITMYTELKQCMECPEDDISNSTLLESFNDFVDLLGKINVEGILKNVKKQYIKLPVYIAIDAQRRKLSHVWNLIRYRKEVKNTHNYSLSCLGSKNMVLPKANASISIKTHRDLYFALALPLAHKRHVKESAASCNFRSIAKTMNDMHKLMIFYADKTLKEMDVNEIDGAAFEKGPATGAIESLIQNQKAIRVAFDKGLLNGPGSTKK